MSSSKDELSRLGTNDPKRRRVDDASNISTAATTNTSLSENDAKPFQSTIPSQVSETIETIKSAIIRSESFANIKAMLESNQADKLWLQRDNQGYNLLHIAAQFEHTEVIQYLISLGIDVNSTNSENNSALHIALYSQKKNFFLESIRLLLENGANMYSFDEKNNTFAHLLPYYLNTEQYHNVVDLLISLGHAEIFHAKNILHLTPLHVAVEEIDVAEATFKIISSECGYDFNKPFPHDGNTLLHYAARWGGTRKTLENLITLGADWKMLNSMQETVLHLAVEGNNFDAINYFISLGADVNARDGLGRTPIHHIESHETESKKHYIELTRLLMEHGADIYAKDNYGETVANDLYSEASREDFEKWARYMVSIGHGKLFSGAVEEDGEQLMKPPATPVQNS